MPKIIALSAEIGRGHPNYLDSVIFALKTRYPQYKLEYHTVFDCISGGANFLWQLIRKLYCFGGSGGIITKFYNSVRQKLSAPSPIMLKRLSPGFNFDTCSSTIFLVEHPLVARTLLAQGLSVFYIHGEIAAPKECAIRGITKCFVPLEFTKRIMVANGVKPESILVTGLLLEPELVNEAAINYNRRLARLKTNEPLTIAFFISQAYPRPHIEKIIVGVGSVLKNKMRAIVFTGTVPDKALKFKYRLLRSKKEQTDWENLQVIMSKSRKEENQKTAELMSKIDIMVAAAHERTNWAVGLGIPMLVLFPLIGTYAEANYNFALNQGVAYPIKTIKDAKNLGEKIVEMRNRNILEGMAKRGFSIHKLDGAQTIAESLQTILNQN